METNAAEGKQYVGMDSSMLMEMAHSKHAIRTAEDGAVSQQFESVLVKQFLKEALKPMFKEFSTKMAMLTGCTAIFLPTRSQKASRVAEVLEFPRFCNNKSAAEHAGSFRSGSPADEKNIGN